nr:carbohydrate ABC transporter permease [Dactylosporangium thailandense]
MTATVAPPQQLSTPVAEATRKRPSGGGRHPVAYLVLTVLALFAVGPFVIMVFNAFKNNAEIGSSPLAPPTSITFDNFATAWSQGDFSTTMRNSAILVLGAMLGTCVIAGLGAYALSHLEVPGGGGVLAYLFLGSTMPVQLFVVPLFSLWADLRLTDSLFGLMVIYWATDAPFATLMLRSFLVKVPKEFVEAARLDGASEVQIARKVMLPLAWPGFMTVALVVGLWAWNEFFWAITFVHDPSKRPISTSFLSFQDQNSTDWGLTSAAALFMLVPVLLLFITLQRRFVAGLTSGGLK